MRRFYIIASIILLSLSAQSQVLITLLFGDKLNTDGVEFGLEGGYNWSKITGLDANKGLSKFNIGFYFDIRLKNQLSLYTGVLVKSNLGVDHLSDKDLAFLKADIYDEVGTYSQVMKNFLVPALARYKFKNHIYVEAGPQFGLAYKAWVEYTANVDGKDGTVKQYNKDAINRLDVGLMAGAGYKLLKGMGWSFGFKYYYGLVDVYKEKSGTKYSTLFLNVCVPIGAEKRPDKPQK